MIKDDIIRMAREANLPDPMVFYASIERFAALVAAEVGIAQWHRGFAEGQAAERQACIDLVAFYGGSVEIEAAIRARGSHDSATRHP